jgi:hypothetical protein
MAQATLAKAQEGFLLLISLPAHHNPNGSPGRGSSTGSGSLGFRHVVLAAGPGTITLRCDRRPRRPAPPELAPLAPGRCAERPAMERGRGEEGGRRYETASA